MSISRRNFLQVGAVAAVAAGAPCLSVLASENKDKKLVSSKGIPIMSKATFAALVNTSFFILPERQKKVKVELIEVQDQVPAADQKRAARAGKECFSLAFRSSSHPRLKQQTYQFKHDALGNFDLFIGAVKSEKHGLVYEAIINHLSN